MIETERLRLRPWRESDLPAFAAMNADPQVRRYFSSRLTREESDASVARFIRMYALDGYGFMATELRETSEFIGLIGIQRMSFFLRGCAVPTVEIGWRLNEKSWRKGLATEGARACLDLAFVQFQLPEIVAFTVPANLPSRRVMEKLGMIRNPDDDFDDPRIPVGNPCQRHVLYRIEKSDWQRGLKKSHPDVKHP
jgi:RimJ/RimL family protein N-acetyltransferase